MKKSKFWDYYSTFSLVERKEWIKFVKSSFHNTNPKIVKLAELLHRNSFGEKLLDRRWLYKRMYGPEPYHDIKLRKLLSASVKLIEQYWVVKSTLSAPKNFQNHLRKCLRDRDLSKHYLRISKELIETIKSHPNNLDYNLLSEINYDILTTAIHFDKVRFFDYAESIQSLDKAQALSKNLLLTLNWLQYREFIALDPSININLPSFEGEPEILNSNYGFQILKRFYHLWISTENITETDLLLLWKDFTRGYNQISKEFSYYFTVLIYNYVRNYRRVSLYSKNLDIDILIFAISKKTLIYKNKGGGEAIYAYCTQLCRMQRIDMAKVLLKDYEIFLANSIRQPIVYLCNCLIYFHESRFDRCYYELLSFSIPAHETCELYRRALLLKASIELLIIESSISDTIMIHIDNYNKYVRRNTQFDDQVIRIYLDFAKYILRTYRLLISPNKNMPDKQTLINEIQVTSSLAKETKFWFIQKLSRL